MWLLSPPKSIRLKSVALHFIQSLSILSLANVIATDASSHQLDPTLVAFDRAPNYQLDLGDGGGGEFEKPQILSSSAAKHQQDEQPSGQLEPDVYDSSDSSDSGVMMTPGQQHDPVSFDPSPMDHNHGHHITRLPEKEYLSHDLAGRACHRDRGCQRKDLLNNTYLSYCTRYKLDNLFSNEILMSIMHDSSEECERILDEFIQLDELINQFNQLFKNLLTRYNCHNGYSVKWSCEDCKKAYADWLCATNLPYYMNGERIKPCISFCERVEQRCPYLHPITKEQYGGQPVFICRDPNIPFVPEITPDIPYSEPAKCYDLCHLSHTELELISDTLSKYDRDKCPVESSIAEQVRSDLQYCKLDTSDEQQQQVNGSKFQVDKPPPIHDSYEPTDQYPTDVDSMAPPTSTNTTKSSHAGAGSHVHIKKLEELREVLSVRERSPHSKHWSTPRTQHSSGHRR